MNFALKEIDSLTYVYPLEEITKQKPSILLRLVAFVSGTKIVKLVGFDKKVTFSLARYKSFRHCEGYVYAKRSKLETVYLLTNGTVWQPSSVKWWSYYG